MSFVGRSWFFGCLAILVLTLNFSGHFLSTLPVERFLNNEFPSEQFVITRLAINNDLGLEYNDNFMLASPHVAELFMAPDEKPYEDFRQRTLEDIEKSKKYNSHIGFQDNLLFPVWKSLYWVRDVVLEKAREGSRWEKRLTHFDSYYIVKVTQFVVALANALILAVILLWFTRQFSVTAGYIILGLVLALSPDLTFFGRSMWWMMFAWFLPFLTVLMAYDHNKGAPLSWWILVPVGVLAGLFLTLKTSMGYEFTSTIMMATIIPISYYAVINKWQISKWFKQCFCVGIFQLGGLALTLYLHFLSLENAGLDAFDIIKENFEKRSHGDENGMASSGLQESVQVSVFVVYLKYLFLNFEFGLPPIFILSPLLIWLWNRREEYKNYFTPDLKERALLMSVALGFIGALSMLTILKGHAYIHSFDIVVFSIPMYLFLFAFYAQQILKRNKLL